MVIRGVLLLVFLQIMQQMSYLLVLVVFGQHSLFGSIYGFSFQLQFLLPFGNENQQIHGKDGQYGALHLFYLIFGLVYKSVFLLMLGMAHFGT